MDLTLKRKVIIAKELHRRKARDDFWSFCLYMDYNFFTERASVLKQIAEAFQEVEQGKLDLLYVGMPPRTGKSYITTLFCAWLLGRYPEESIMRNTVTSKLYSKFSNDLKGIMKGITHKGRYLEVFPDIKLASENVEGWKLEQSRTGMSYFGAGVGGSIIGFGATKVAILDDSIKDVEEAMSETMLEKKWNWYTGVHQSRMEKGCPEIHIATRWSKKDIPGKLIELKKFDSPKAKQIVIPALINGKSFCEAVQTTKYYLEKKRTTPDIIWEAEYMQNPIEAQGLLFPAEELNRFSIAEIEGKNPAAVIGFCDTADEGTDYHSFPIAYQLGDKYYIVDVVFTQDPVEVTIPLTVDAIIRNGCQMATIESNNGGRIFSKDVKEKLKEKGQHCTINTQATTKNKETRILMQSAYIKENFYFRNDYKAGSAYAKFMEQLTTYTKMGGSKHDDAPDSLTGLAEMIRGNQRKAGAWGR